MTLFILAICVIASIYTGLHYYAFHKFVKIFPHHRRALIASLYLLGLSLFIVEVLTHTGFTRFIFPFTWLTFFWMGLVFLFFVLSAPLDLLAVVSKWFHFSDVHQYLTSQRRTALVAVATLLIALQGFYTAQQINVETIAITSPKIHSPLRIVQITDLHLGLLTREQHIDELIEKINRLKPDIIVSTGDL
ncbi:MAG: hypothetical protein R3240_12090, partial [Gammaproteobacteria bacterium]|nr:hypothetical protein [Gammaproteobacteria bacterium]